MRKDDCAPELANNKRKKNTVQLADFSLIQLKINQEILKVEKQFIEFKISDYVFVLLLKMFICAK